MTKFSELSKRRRVISLRPLVCKKQLLNVSKNYDLDNFKESPNEILFNFFCVLDIQAVSPIYLDQGNEIISNFILRW